MKKTLISTITSMTIAIASLGAFPIEAYAGQSGPIVVNTSWQRVYPDPGASASNPINDNLHIQTQSLSNTHTDIRFLNANGTVVWEECCAIDYNCERTFWCGSNVYVVEARSHWGGPINIGSHNTVITCWTV